MAVQFIASSYCPRCDNAYAGSGATKEAAKADANNKVREHLVRARGAEMDDGLHDFALEQWDTLIAEAPNAG